MKKVIIIQRVVPEYRVDFFKGLANECDLTVLYGNGTKKGAQKNSLNIGDSVIFKKLFSIVFHARFKRFDVFFSFFPTLFFQLMLIKPSLIVTEGATNFPNNCFVYLYSLISGVPVVYWDAGRDVRKKMGLLRLLFENFFVLFQRMSALIFSYTVMGKEYFISNGIDSNKIIVLNNSISIDDMGGLANRCEDIEAVIESQDKHVLLIIGALEKRKLIAEFLYSFASSKILSKECCLVFVGDGEESCTLQNIAIKLNLSAFFFGSVYVGKDAYFTISDAVIFPGWSTLAVVEALSFNKPVFAASHGGPEYQYVIDGVNGYLHEPSRISDLIQNLEAWVQGEFIPRFESCETPSIDAMIQKANSAIQTFLK